MAVNFDLLDDAEWGGSRRAIDPSEIPSKITDMVKRLDANRAPVFIPGDDPAYREEVAPYFKAAALLIDRQARVWPIYDEDADVEEGAELPYIGSKVSVGKRRSAATVGSDTADESD
jgi:hypothetical protein